jgi:hypothetical protein
MIQDIVRQVIDADLRAAEPRLHRAYRLAAVSPRR